MYYAERLARESLGRSPFAGLTATDWLEGYGIADADSPITVRIDIRDCVLHADFTGTAPAVRGNVNCPLAVARSAVLFVVRTLLPEDVPTNGGVERAVRLTAPEGCLVNARHPSAVAAGNVETSQRIVDTLFLALARGGIAVPAQGQGTMNNVTFGGESRGRGKGEGWTYYETIGGGQGARRGENRNKETRHELGVGRSDRPHGRRGVRAVRGRGRHPHHSRPRAARRAVPTHGAGHVARGAAAPRRLARRAPVLQAR